MSSVGKEDKLSKILMGAFLLFIIIFVSISSWIYFTNSTNVAIRIQTDDEINKEKTAVNEALIKTLVLKNDSIISFKTEVQKKDSIISKKVFKLEHERDSLKSLISKFKKSDIQPIVRKQVN
jgi:uncharacterized membrane protein